MYDVTGKAADSTPNSPQMNNSCSQSDVACYAVHRSKAIAILEAWTDAWPESRKLSQVGNLQELMEACLAGLRPLGLPFAADGEGSRG